MPQVCYETRPQEPLVCSHTSPAVLSGPPTYPLQSPVASAHPQPAALFSVTMGSGQPSGARENLPAGSTEWPWAQLRPQLLGGTWGEGHHTETRCEGAGLALGTPPGMNRTRQAAALCCPDASQPWGLPEARVVLSPPWATFGW